MHARMPAASTSAARHVECTVKAEKPTTCLNCLQCQAFLQLIPDIRHFRVLIASLKRKALALVGLLLIDWCGREQAATNLIAPRPAAILGVQVVFN